MENNKDIKKSFLSAQVDLSKFNASNFEKATDDEKRQQDVMGESTTFLKDGLRRLRKNPLAMGSIVVLVAIILVILVYSYQKDRSVELYLLISAFESLKIYIFYLISSF